ncbi:MFS transporter [Vibrio salinus]|uniref:MFS transporter n=1 Tax=Vibrio salinus TaxID=2899784 RepID=UPI001E5752FF|nr:MFS transporter [Vibrio salinus]MCE0495806.1 MFS transporter [Vibrio salinus]
MEKVRVLTRGQVTKYATGDIVGSLVINGVATFALLYYTGAVGLSATWAGLALSISIFWDAISDPITGYLSDNTKSKYGRRHPWMLISGILLAISFYFIWVVPDFFKQTEMLTFSYLLAVNLLIRTFLTGFFVPFNALAYDICTDYNGRTKLQSVKMLFQMGSNFLGPGLAWMIFFPQANDVNHSSNFELMGAVFSGVILLFVLICTYMTKEHIINSEKTHGTISEKAGFLSFFKDTKLVFKSRDLILIFLFAILFQSAAVFMANLQQYVYQYVLQLTGLEKTIINGGTMIGAALGAFIGSLIAEQIGKKNTNYVAAIIATLSGVGTAFFLLSDLFIHFHFIRISIFSIGNIAFWFGFGVTMPVIASMIADIAEAHYLQSGLNQEGTFGAVYSLAIKGATSFGTFIVGILLSYIGFISGQEAQSNDVLVKIVLVGFIVGPLLTIFASLFLKGYHLSKENLESMRKHKSVIHTIDESEILDNNLQQNSTKI